MNRANEGSTSKSAAAAATGVGEQLRDAVSGVGENLRDMGSQARAAAEEKYQELREHASDYYEQGRDMAHDWEQTLEGYVQEKPLQSLLIAAGVGLLLGILWKRK